VLGLLVPLHHVKISKENQKKFKNGEQKSPENLKEMAS